MSTDIEFVNNLMATFRRGRSSCAKKRSEKLNFVESLEVFYTGLKRKISKQEVAAIKFVLGHLSRSHDSWLPLFQLIKDR